MSCSADASSEYELRVRAIIIDAPIGGLEALSAAETSSSELDRAAAAD